MILWKQSERIITEQWSSSGFHKFCQVFAVTVINFIVIAREVVVRDCVNENESSHSKRNNPCFHFYYVSVIFQERRRRHRRCNRRCRWQKGQN